jgi:hypothetical protein
MGTMISGPTEPGGIISLQRHGEIKEEIVPCGISSSGAN